MSWIKKGLVFKPTGQGGWMNSHAAVPSPLLKDDVIRVYVGVRPEQSLTLPTFVDLDINDPTKVLYVNEKPLLSLGRPGTFDEFGVTPTHAMHVGGLVYLYYTGWTRGQTVTYINSIGLAISEDGGKSFERYSEGPIADRKAHEPYSAMAPFVMRDKDNWQMWYSSGVDWVKPVDKYEPVYNIKTAYSSDGVHWEQPNITCIKSRYPGEANTRPSVIFENGIYKMWYCYRGSDDFRNGGKGSYKIGYAESSNGKDWTRLDHLAGIAASDEGWDQQMVTYPRVIDTPSGRLMFYVGNGFGASGFGCAKWVA